MHKYNTPPTPTTSPKTVPVTTCPSHDLCFSRLVLVFILPPPLYRPQPTPSNTSLPRFLLTLFSLFLLTLFSLFLLTLFTFFPFFFFSFRSIFQFLLRRRSFETGGFRHVCGRHDGRSRRGYRRKGLFFVDC